MEGTDPSHIVLRFAGPRSGGVAAAGRQSIFPKNGQIAVAGCHDGSSKPLTIHGCQSLRSGNAFLGAGLSCT
jgi:hypothetical protein